MDKKFGDYLDETTNISDAMTLLKFRDVAFRKKRPDFDVLQVKDILVHEQKLFTVINKTGFGVLLRGMIWAGGVPSKAAAWRFVYKEDLNDYWAVSREDGLILAKTIILMDKLGPRTMVRHGGRNDNL